MKPFAAWWRGMPCEKLQHDESSGRRGGEVWVCCLRVCIPSVTVHSGAALQALAQAAALNGAP
jgi:hypothetical protein